MKLNKKYLLATVPALALVGLVAASSVSAANPQGLGGEHGFGMDGRGGFHMGIGNPDNFLERLTSEAAMLGISVDEMKTYWSQGKGVKEIATEKGITEEQMKTKMEAAREAKVTTELKALVDKGIITQAQADARLTAMKTMKAKMVEQMKNKVQNKVQNKLQNKLQKRGAKPVSVQTGTATTQS